MLRARTFSIPEAALAGSPHDNTGGYEIAWTSYAILGAASIPMILTARRPGKRTRAA
ncbi:MAG: hypothetical protein HY671_12940 [Chloroflexi bacterium]|nr:hypothetical protein [Chloroflexota bacterium]